MAEAAIKNYIKPAIARLESVYAEVAKTHGFNSESEKLLILIELLKEQLSHENSDHTAG